MSRVKIIEARQRKQWDNVKYYAQKQLDLEPDDLFAIDAIGEALEKQGFVDEALQQYERALLADRPRYFIDKHTFLLQRLDILYHRAGRYEDCLRVCNYYTKHHASLWDAWNRLRRAAQKTGDMELSITAKERADAIKAPKEAEQQAIKAQREAEKQEDEARYSFYERWLQAWRRGNALDIESEYGCLFDFMHDLIRSVRKKVDTRLIIDELTKLRIAYPYDGTMDNRFFHLHSLEYIADAHVVLQEYHDAVDTLSTAYQLGIPIGALMHTSKLLSLKTHIGGEVSGYDLLFLWGTPELTQWGRKNISFVAECAEDVLDKYHVDKSQTILSLWASKTDPTLGNRNKFPTNPPRETITLFDNVVKRFKTKIPYYYFMYLRPFSKKVTVLVREAENIARNRRGIPRIGEGWVAETDLYYKIKECFPKYLVEHHASPSWLGIQHLDIYIPKMKVAVEYQGTQHDEPVEFFGGKEAYLKTRQRDERKLALCKENGVSLLYVREGYKFADIVTQIELAVARMLHASG